MGLIVACTSTRSLEAVARSSDCNLSAKYPDNVRASLASEARDGLWRVLLAVEEGSLGESGWDCTGVAIATSRRWDSGCSATLNQSGYPNCRYLPSCSGPNITFRLAHRTSVVPTSISRQPCSMRLKCRCMFSVMLENSSNRPEWAEAAKLYWRTTTAHHDTSCFDLTAILNFPGIKRKITPEFYIFTISLIVASESIFPLETPLVAQSF